MSTATVLSLLALLSTVSSFLHYQYDIPNGNIVPNPCLIGFWPGVGHLVPDGAGFRNEFGLDFAAAGHIWTVDLCMKDSDRDGRTNGEDIGDPNCRFTPTYTGRLGAPESHPGICEPIGSSRCAWQGFFC